MRCQEEDAMLLRRILLAGGVLASLLYVAADVLAAICYPAYHSFTSRAISELMARGAPTERLVDPLFLAYGVLAIGFGIGVWMSAGPRRLLRVLGGLQIAYALVGLPGPVLFEMNLRGTGEAGDDVLHIAVTGVLVLLILSQLVVGAFVHGRRFRVYTLATLVILIVAGGLSALEGRHLAAGEPTPWLGILERINIGGYLLWVVVLAISLLRGEPGRNPVASRHETC
jgi:hypothetical protein